MNKKLKKCPFCGSDVLYTVYEKIKEYNKNPLIHIIECTNCSASMEYWAQPDEEQETCKDMLFHAWNERVD